MKKMKFLALVMTVVIFISCGSSTKQNRGGDPLQTNLEGLPDSKEEVEQIIHKVNQHWQEKHPEHGWAFWHDAAYHTGNIEAYKVTGKEEYLAYSKAWAENNQWMGAKSTDKSKWKYNYGETDEHVLFGDWQIAFQTYIDIYTLEGQKDPKKIERAREVMEYQMSTDESDYWWWADGLYMVMPVMTKLYKVTGNEQYLEKLDEYLSYADSIMYDEEAQLYYRDAKYVYPQHKSENDKKDFWARGDGWVFAGFAKVLQDLPGDAPNRKKYEQRFKDMAEAIANAQQEEGYWTRSMLDPEHAPGPETSGTAFFTYGFLWGINNNLLDREIYLPVVKRSWDYLTTMALQENGAVGYVQPIGEKAIPGQVVDKNSTSDFGVGAFLLAASEMYRFVTDFNINAQGSTNTVFDNPLALQRADPFVTKADDDTYYFIATVPEYDRIELRSSKTINGIKEAQPVVVWRKHNKGPMGNHIWAPELHRIGDKWYIYFAAGSAENKWNIKMYALSNSSEDPTKGKWEEEGQIVSNRDDFALDATTFELEGQRYMIWTDRASDEVVNTGLYIAEMTSPTTLAKKQIVISQPEYDWEIQGHRVNEGPAVLVRNGKVFVTFSASATDANYSIGLLWADQDSDLLNPDSWNKVPEPVLFTNREHNRYGPGHNSFTVAEDGKTDVMIYHAREYEEIEGEPLYDPNRHTRARVLKWGENDMPFFGQNLSDSQMGLE